MRCGHVTTFMVFLSWDWVNTGNMSLVHTMGRERQPYSRVYFVKRCSPEDVKRFVGRYFRGFARAFGQTRGVAWRPVGT